MYWMATNGHGGASPRHVPPHFRPSQRDTAERHAEATAADWQVILHLRTLIARDPAIVLQLLADARHQPISYTTTIYAATREAISDHPDRPMLHYYAAAAAAQLGRFREAEAALDESIRLEPKHPAAHLLAARVALETRQHDRVHERLSLAETAGACPNEIAAIRDRLGSRGRTDEREATRE